MSIAKQRAVSLIPAWSLAFLQTPLKANYRQDFRMGFKGRKKGKYEGAKKFIEKIKEIQEKAKAVLGKAQEEMKK